MTEKSPTEWEHLGQLMRARRVELGGANRARFLEDRGLGESQYRLIMDMENGKRENFERSSIDVVEWVYEWEPGSVQAVLAGGRPTPRTVNLDRSAATAGEEAAERFIALVRADPELLDVSKDHLIVQYRLLPRRVSHEGSTTVTFLDDRREEKPARTDDDQPRGSRAARRGPEPKGSQDPPDDS